MKLVQAAALVTIAVWLCVASGAMARRGRKYDTSFKGYSDDKLNVHLTCHTHDDVGTCWRGNAVIGFRHLSLQRMG